MKCSPWKAERSKVVSEPSIFGPDKKWRSGGGIIRWSRECALHDGVVARQIAEPSRYERGWTARVELLLRGRQLCAYSAGRVHDSGKARALANAALCRMYEMPGATRPGEDCIDAVRRWPAEEVFP